MRAVAPALVLVAAAAASAEWTVGARVEPSVVTVGESARLTVTVTGEVGSVALPPAVTEPSWGAGLVAVGFRFENQWLDRRQFRHDISWTLVCDQEGRLRVPPVAVTLRDAHSGVPTTRRSAPQRLDVLPDAALAPLAEERGRRLAATDGSTALLRGWVLGGLSGAILLSAVAAGVLLRRTAPPVRVGGVPLDTPEGRCLRGLRGAALHLARDDSTGFYREVTAALQAYVGAGSGSTSSEVRALLARAGSPTELRQAAGTILAAADGVRFARGAVTSEQSWELLRQLELGLTSGRSAVAKES